MRTRVSCARCRPSRPSGRWSGRRGPRRAPRGASARPTARRGGLGAASAPGRRGPGASIRRSPSCGGASASPPSQGRGAGPRRRSSPSLEAGPRARRVHPRRGRPASRALGGAGVSKSRSLPRTRSGVSRLRAEIDERVGAFLTRPIEGRWPRPWLDATDLKVREDGVRARPRAWPRTGGGRALTVSRAVMVAVAVNEDARRPWAGPCLPRAASRPAGPRPDRSPRVLGIATGPSEAKVRLGPGSFRGLGPTPPRPGARPARRGAGGGRRPRGAAGRRRAGRRPRRLGEAACAGPRGASAPVGAQHRGAVSATPGAILARGSGARPPRGGGARRPRGGGARPPVRCARGAPSSAR